MYTLEKKFYFHSSVKKIWSALTEQKSIREWLGGTHAVTLDLSVGGKYSFFDGEITGKFTEIAEPNALAYTWRRDDWSLDWTDSLVRFEIKGYGLDTQIRLTHSNLPSEDELDRQEESWEIDFLEPMREWAETSKNVIFGVAPFRRQPEQNTDPNKPK